MIRRIVRHHLWIAAALAAIVVSTGLIWDTRVAAGSDAYGYTMASAASATARRAAGRARVPRLPAAETGAGVP